MLPLQGFSQYDTLINKLKSVDASQQSRIFLAYIESYPVKKSKNWSINMHNTVLRYADSTQNKDLHYQANYRLKQINAVTAYPEASWIERFQTLANEYHKDNSPLLEAFCYHEMGQLQFQKEKYESAFEYNRKVLAILSKIGYEKHPISLKSYMKLL